MSKVVGIQKNLEGIGRELEARGYEVVHDSYEGYVDAILYDSDQNSLSYLDNFDNAIDMDRGAILVNTKGKRLREIIYAIERRTYESLF